MSETITTASPFDDGELYDAMLHGLDYAIIFYVDLARAARGPVLDVACGTGRISIPCLQAGADLDGIDLSAPMLNTFRKKAAALKLATNLYQADMSQFELPRKYLLIMITFNAFIHNLTQDTQISCLQSCRRHLLPGGLLVFDTFFPNREIICAIDSTRVLECETKHPQTGLPIRLYDTRSFDRVKQVQHSINDVELLDAEGNIAKVHRSEFDTRWVYPTEMALLLRVAGFSRWEICGNFDRRPLTKETDNQIVFAWADGSTN